jgi:hypothetical protein
MSDFKLLGTDEYSELESLGASSFLLKKLKAAVTEGAFPGVLACDSAPGFAEALYSGSAAKEGTDCTHG